MHWDKLTWLLTSPVSSQEDMTTVSLAIEDKVCLWQIVDDEGDAYPVIVLALQRNEGISTGSHDLRHNNTHIWPSNF